MKCPTSLGWVALGLSVTMRGGLNFTDQKYFECPNVRGRSATDLTIDRYSSPGISGVVSVSTAGKGEIWRRMECTMTMRSSIRDGNGQFIDAGTVACTSCSTVYR